MPAQRKLGRATDQRKSILQNLVTGLMLNGKIVTTVARAKETKRIIEKLITLAVREQANFTTAEVVTSSAKLDSKGHKLLKTKTSKNDKKYDVVERELKTKTVQIDNPSRLAARKKTMKWLRKSHDEKGNPVNPVNKLFDEVALKYVNRSGGYTRIIPIGTRRGDASQMAIIELV